MEQNLSWAEAFPDPVDDVVIGANALIPYAGPGNVEADVASLSLHDEEEGDEFAEDDWMDDDDEVQGADWRDAHPVHHAGGGRHGTTTPAPARAGREPSRDIRPAGQGDERAALQRRRAHYGNNARLPGSARRGPADHRGPAARAAGANRIDELESEGRKAQRREAAIRAALEAGLEGSLHGAGHEQRVGVAYSAPLLNACEPWWENPVGRGERVWSSASSSGMKERRV